MARIIHALAAQHPESRLDVTGCRSYAVADHPADSLISGSLLPNVPELEGLTGQALSFAMVVRYGVGFGFPWERDTTVLPAVSFFATEQNRNRGWVNEHSMPEPSSATLAQLGFIGTLSTTDLMDISACYHFQELIAQMNSELETPLVTPPVSPVTPSEPAKSPSDDVASTPELVRLRAARDQVLALVSQAEGSLPPAGRGGVYVRIAHVAFDAIKKALTT